MTWLKGRTKETSSETFCNTRISNSISLLLSNVRKTNRKSYKKSILKFSCILSEQRIVVKGNGEIKRLYTKSSVKTFRLWTISNVYGSRRTDDIKTVPDEKFLLFPLFIFRTKGDWDKKKFSFLQKHLRTANCSKDLEERNLEKTRIKNKLHRKPEK